MASHYLFQCDIGAKRSFLMKTPTLFLDTVAARLKSGGKVVAAELRFLAIQIISHHESVVAAFVRQPSDAASPRYPKRP
jgi:hypothetical protein